MSLNFIRFLSVCSELEQQKKFNQLLNIWGFVVRDILQILKQDLQRFCLSSYNFTITFVNQKTLLVKYYVSCH